MSSLLSFIRTTLPHAHLYHEQLFAKHEILSLCFDSRKLQPGQWFIALSGAQADGHAFVVHAVEQGAVGLIISTMQVLDQLTPQQRECLAIIHVDDTQAALVALATAWRASLKVPVVGITGSVGKTSTKQMLASVLAAAEIPAAVSYGNQNTLVGLSVNLLRVKPTDEVVVCELGINERGEMDQLVELVRPTIGVVTAIAAAHTAGLGSVAEIADEKCKIFRYAELAIINGDYSLLNERTYQQPVVCFGTTVNAQIKLITCDGCNIVIDIDGQQLAATLQSHHVAFRAAALAATAVARALNIDCKKLVTGLEAYVGYSGRFECKRLKDGRGYLISDCYNASPISVQAAIEAFDQSTSPDGQPCTKVMVLGDMRELGEQTAYWHEQVAMTIAAKASSVGLVVLVGDQMKQVAGLTTHEKRQVLLADDWQGAISLLNQMFSDRNFYCLVKAARSMQFDKIVDYFSEN